MNKAQATVLAGVAAPLPGSLVLSASIANGFQLPAWGAFGLLPLVYNWAIVAELVLAGPLIYLGWRWNLIRWWSTIVCGGLVGFAVPIAIQPSQLATIGAHMADLAVMSAIGAGSGLTFWLVWRLGKDAPTLPQIAG